MCFFYYDAKLKGKIKIENMASPRRLRDAYGNAMRNTILCFISHSTIPVIYN